MFQYDLLNSYFFQSNIEIRNVIMDAGNRPNASGTVNFSFCLKEILILTINVAYCQPLLL